MSETVTTPVAPEPPPTANKKNGKRIILYLAVAGALFIGLGVFGIYARNQWTAEVQARANQAARILVEVVRPQTAGGVIHLQLPGEAMPFTDSPIVAQTSGYLKKWYFDIGAHVKKGDVLAEIDTPEVDQQLAQAQAQLNVAQAASDLAEITYKRDQDLYQTKVIAAQDFDTAADSYAGARSTVIADEAVVGRLQALEAFKIVRAPFDGIVTARNTDIGDFIAAGSATPLFRMEATSVLRVYVTVPQVFSSLVKAGEQATLAVNEFPGQTFPAHVVSTAGAISPTSKRLLTELEAANPTGAPLPGAFVQTTLDIPIDGRGVMIPATSLLFQGTQPAVAVVSPDGKVEIRKITLTRDLGTRLQVANGLSRSDQVIVNPPVGLVTGGVVTVVKSNELTDVAE
jgi:RND family efflux transporter MFP subunit